MRFLIDVNMPKLLATQLSNAGHDVEEVYQWNPRAEDPSILQRAKDEQRILITADLWFGNIRMHPVGSYPGIVVVRPKALQPQEAVALVTQAIETYGETLTGKLAILDRNRTRIREPRQERS